MLFNQEEQEHNVKKMNLFFIEVGLVQPQKLGTSTSYPNELSIDLLS